MDDPLIALADELLAKPEEIRSQKGKAEGVRQALLRATLDPTKSE
ncbi:MAG TPA: hypothetical protein VII49_01035 [Rhizomicrobium sp.]